MESGTAAASQHVGRENMSRPEDIGESLNTKPTSKWRDFISPNAPYFSIGPRIEFLFTADKDENTEMKIGQLGKDKAVRKPMGSNWDIARGLWHNAERFSSNADTRYGFQKFLSIAQFHSFVMLQEWLHSKYEIEAMIRELYDWLYLDRMTSLVYEGQRSESHIANNKWRQRTLYQKVMADLFRAEFSPRHWVAETKQDVLKDLLFREVDNCRRLAWQARTAQRISWKFTCVSWNEGLEKSTKLFTTFENPLPRTKYCPWLKKDLSRSGFPRYLWHITSKRTVDTQQLPRRVEYTCISHTWGRWRRKQFAVIPHVPWQVPLNSRFDVVGLPDTFYRLKDRFPTEYIWIDLFCIPQKADDPQLLLITTEEIARQAAIFQNAVSCVAWLNYVNHWVAEYCTIGWLSAQFALLASQPGFCIANSLLDAAEHGCHLPLQLTRFSTPTFGYSQWRQKFIQYRDGFYVWWRYKRKWLPYYHFEPSDWFSGVWTLQEAYLRPNMILADRNWNILCDPAGEPISLEELFALDHVVWDLGTYGTQLIGGFLLKGHGVEGAPVDELMQIHRKDGFKEKCPPGPRQLTSMIAKTHLFSRSLGSRVDPLIQANGRFCTAGRSGRAEAIMSSLGITDWYKRSSKIEDDELVLDMYPLEFLREASSKIGPDFYLATNKSPSPWVLFNPFTRTRGTLLPIGRAGDSRYRMKSVTDRGTPPCGHRGDFHPSVLSWQIQPNGHTRIRQAAILASSREQSMISHSLVLLGFWGSRHRESQEVILSDWITKQSKIFDTFAVCLTNGGPHNTGLILQGRRLGKSIRLIKVGYFTISPDSIAFRAVPISQRVNWIVV